MLRKAIQIESFADSPNLPIGVMGSLRLFKSLSCFPPSSETIPGATNFQPKADGFVTCQSPCLALSLSKMTRQMGATRSMRVASFRQTEWLELSPIHPPLDSILPLSIPFMSVSDKQPINFYLFYHKH